MKTPPIPDKLFFKIGEVSDIAGVEQHVLRYWEEEYDHLRPDKNRSGQRLFQKKIDGARIFLNRNVICQNRAATFGRKSFEQIQLFIII